MQSGKWLSPITQPLVILGMYVVCICLAFTYVVAMTDEKASHVIKAMKSAMLVVGVPWAFKTDNGPAYSY